MKFQKVGNNMLKDAKVATSKFLQLKDNLNHRIMSNKGYDNSLARVYGTSEVTCNIGELQRAFGELCELLHELTVEEKVKETNLVKPVKRIVKCKYCEFYIPYEKPVEDFDGRCSARCCETDEEEFCSYGILRRK